MSALLLSILPAIWDNTTPAIVGVTKSMAHKYALNVVNLPQSATRLVGVNMPL